MVNFKQQFEKATSSDLSDPDWEIILEIVEDIKTKNVNVKTVMKEFRRRLLDNDSKVVYHTLLVLDSVMKNCSTEVHSEVLSKEFMNIIKQIVTSSKDGGRAVDKALELIGEWKMAFGQQSDYKAVQEAFFELEKDGYHIPETQVASAAFIKKPPDFVLGDHCYTCRQEFNRFKGHFRHHCRNCGKSVCAQCSGKRAPLPEYGIEQPTRVCDLCYKKMDTGAASTSSSTATPPSSATSDLPPEYLHSSLAKESQAPTPQSSDTQFQEDDDLQMAIAMSLNEAENKDKQPPKRAPSPSLPPQTTPSAPPPPAASTLYASIVHEPTPAVSQPNYYNGGPPEPAQDSDPSLARYLDRNYWEQRKDQQVTPPTSSSAPPPSNGPSHVVTTTNATGPPAMVLSHGVTGSPLAESVRKTVEMFIQRLHEVSSAGGSVATDPVVLSHYQNLSALQPQLLQQIDDVQQKKAHQQGIIHKLTEAKEARVTLNKMRREHQDKLRQQEQEQTMLARMQMEQKLALLRQQKAEQLTFQQVLQQQRLDELQIQRSEYEKQLQQQRETERQLLIAKEQQVLQHQFGQSEPIPLQSLNPGEQAQPLPVKVEYNPTPVDPPPYQPSVPFIPAQQSFSSDGLYQTTSTQPLSYQQPVTIAPPPTSIGQTQVYGTSPSSHLQPATGPPTQPLSLGALPSLPQQPQSFTAPQPSSMPAGLNQPAQSYPTPQPAHMTQPTQPMQSFNAAQLSQPMQSFPTSQPAQMTQPMQLSQPGQITQSFQPAQSYPVSQHPQQAQMTQPDGQYSQQAQMTQPDGQYLQQAQMTQPDGQYSQQQPPQYQPQSYDQQQFVAPQGGFVPNGAQQQQVGVANGYAPPSNRPPMGEPPLISFD